MSRDPIREYMRAQRRARRERIMYAIIAWMIIVVSGAVMTLIVWGFVTAAFLVLA